MLECLLLGGAIIMFNVLDSVTTELGFRLPEHLRTEESNPFVKIFLKDHPIYAHTVKQVAIIAIVAFLILVGDMRIILMSAVMLGLVVANNTYLWLGRKITKRKIPTPFYCACKACHIPDNCMYFVWVALTLLIAFPIAYLLF